MTRTFWMMLAVCAVGGGCRGPQYYDAPQAKVPPTFATDGTRYTVEDRRPEWEKKPFTGSATLYHLTKVKPDPFEQVVQEAKTVVAASPEKPTSVTITVTSCRLVKMDEDQVKNELLTANSTLVPGVTWSWFLEKPEDLYPKGITEHPDGASCKLEATVTLEFAGKPQKVFQVKTIASGQNVSGTPYWGEALESAARGAAFQFGRQFRTAVGLPADG